MSPGRYLDTLGVWDATAGQPEQGLAAIAASAEVLEGATLPDRAEIRSVAIVGMGAAGTAADAVAAYGADLSSLPIWVGKGYTVPAFVGPHTLVFALSATGTTEETCDAFAAAGDRGAHLVVVSGGGELSAMALASGLPHFPVPAGGPSPRAALGFLTVPVLLTLARLGIVPDVTPALRAAFTSLRRRRDTFVSLESPAEAVARRIGRTMPLVYGSNGLSAVAAQRWKIAVNENAKTPAFFAVQPDLCHNEVAGWGQHGDVTRQVFSLVTLRHAGEHPQVARRFAHIVDVTDEVMANVIAVWAEGDDDLSRFFDLSLFGEFVSLALAGREAIDPGPTPAVSDMESALRLSSARSTGSHAE